MVITKLPHKQEVKCIVAFRIEIVWLRYAAPLKHEYADLNSTFKLH
jgi:hypothetical protein